MIEKVETRHANTNNSHNPCTFNYYDSDDDLIDDNVSCDSDNSNSNNTLTNCHKTVDVVKDKTKYQLKTDFYYDLNYLSNVRSLTIDEWPDRDNLTQYFSAIVFPKFRKIENIKLVANTLIQTYD